MAPSWFPKNQLRPDLGAASSRRSITGVPIAAVSSPREHDVRSCEAQGGRRPDNPWKSCGVLCAMQREEGGSAVA